MPLHNSARAGALARLVNVKYVEDKMKNLMKRFVREEEGQDLIEYALLVVFIALVVALVLPGVGTAISNVFSDIVDQLNG